MELFIKYLPNWIDWLSIILGCLIIYISLMITKKYRSKNSNSTHKMNSSKSKFNQYVGINGMNPVKLE